MQLHMTQTEPNTQANVCKEFWQAQKNTLSFFSNEISAERKSIIIFVILTVLASVVNFIVPYCTQKLIDIAIPKNNIRIIASYSIFIVISIFLSLFINLEIIRRAGRISQNIFAALRERLLFSLLSKNPVFFNHFSSGDIMTRFSNDLENVYSFFYLQLMYSFIFMVAAFGYTLWLLYMNWILALYIIILYVLSIILIQKSYRTVFFRANKSQTEYSNLNDSLLDTISGVEDIRIYQQKGQFIKRFNIVNKAYADATFSLYFIKDALWGILNHIFKFSAAVPIIAGAIMIYYKIGNVTLGLIIAFSQIAIYCSEYISYFEYVLLSNSSIAVSVDRINKLFNDYPEPAAVGLTIQQTPDIMNIEFRNASFSYQPQKPIFRNLNLKISCGEKVALMAPSGFGKSTLANLLLRFRRLDSGNIYFGGQDIWAYPENFYLSFFSYVSQNTHIFKMSVKENIEMGWYIPDTDNFTRILKTLRLYETIEILPQKIDTVLNRDGIELSEGQKQRIALGRALIREPQILLLDEFTSALDRDTENNIIDDLLKLVDKQTIICITHSQYVADKMERIIHLPDIVEN